MAWLGGGAILPTPTPTATDSAGSRGHKLDGTKYQDSSGWTLTNAALAVAGEAEWPDQLLPTPVAHDSGNSPEEHLRKKPGREVVTSLAIIVENDLLLTGGVPTPPPSPPTPDSSDGPHQTLR